MTKKQIKLERQRKNTQRKISMYTHLGHSKGQYAKAGVFKQRLGVTRESKSINCPKSRFTIGTPKDSRINYKFDTHKHTITSKPKEWVRIGNKTILKAKMLKHGSLK